MVLAVEDWVVFDQSDRGWRLDWGKVSSGLNAENLKGDFSCGLFRQLVSNSCRGWRVVEGLIY